MVLLHLVVEIPCLLQIEGPHEDPLKHEEVPLPLTGIVIVCLMLKLLKNPGNNSNFYFYFIFIYFNGYVFQLPCGPTQPFLQNLYLLLTSILLDFARETFP